MQVTAWITVTPLNGWSAGPLPAAARVIGNDAINPFNLLPVNVGAQVFLKGSLTAGTKSDGTIIGTMPPGMAPTNTLTFPTCPSDSGTGGDPSPRLSIDPDGNIRCYGLSLNTDVSLSGIDFSTDE